MHIGKNIIIKEGIVDLDIIPVVKWLNKFNDITTIFSCQGTNKSYPPYVLFYCMDEKNLIDILYKLDHFGCIKINYFKGNLRYNLVFNSYDSLILFVNILKKEYNYV